MLDFSSLPKPRNGTIDYFLGGVGVNVFMTSLTWVKPKSCFFVRIICIGGGGSGGRGALTSSGVARAGGGGGGSGAVAIVTIPSSALPDVLYVNPGQGGYSDANQSNGGFPSTVSAHPWQISSQTPTASTFCWAGGGNPGGTAVNATAGTAGTAGVAYTNANAYQTSKGHLWTLTGQSGGAGGASITYPTSGLMVSGGGGGGASNGTTAAVGGSVFAPASQLSLFVLFTVRISSVNAIGANGVSLSQPLMSCGGAGGSSAIGTGSYRGGDGGFGSGGGGGGGAQIGVTTPAGGNGGPGLIIIQTW